MNLVILSGGADSTICAAIAQSNAPTHAITFNYGQRHQIEIDSAIAVAKALTLASHEVIDCRGILKSMSPLTSETPVETYQTPDDVPCGIASTFVPVRNLFFLAIAANRAIALGCNSIYIGVCQTDFSGYPDCRQSFLDATEMALFQALETRIKIHAPLMWRTKAASVELGRRYMGDRFAEVMGLTHTCYQGVKGGCGECAACLLRDRGFRDAGIDDPIWQYRNG